jgi:hypothetical protein
MVTGVLYPSDEWRKTREIESKYSAAIGKPHKNLNMNTATQPKLKLPKPQRYLLRYKKDGLETMFEVSNPIEIIQSKKTDILQDGTKINVYVFAAGGHSPGIRTFKVENITEMKKIGPSVKGT